MPGYYFSAGARLGQWTTLEDANAVNDWILCRCDCGTERRVNAYSLYRGRSKSCGCMRNGYPLIVNSIGPIGNHPLYFTWAGMIQRCLNPRNSKYPDYGARGITVCERWQGSPQGFRNFAADMGERPPGYTLDRTDNDGPYSPDNCGWADPSTQRSNQRSVRKLQEENRILKADNEILRADILELRQLVRELLAEKIGGDE